MAEELLSRSPERGGIGLELQILRPKAPLGEVKPPRRDLGNLDERLSLIVTDKGSTKAIKFSEVMQKLARDVQMKDIDLFQRWWDTANKAPGYSGGAPNEFCDSESEADGKLSTKNGFLYQCPRDEGGRPVPIPSPPKRALQCLKGGSVYSDRLQQPL